MGGREGALCRRAAPPGDMWRRGRATRTAAAVADTEYYLLVAVGGRRSLKGYREVGGVGSIGSKRGDGSIFGRVGLSDDVDCVIGN